MFFFLYMNQICIYLGGDLHCALDDFMYMTTARIMVERNEAKPR